jgi:serine/threonine protein kinase
MNAPAPAAVALPVKPAVQGREHVDTRIEPVGEDLPSAPPDMADLLGRQIGNYVIQCALGRGGMAVVYLARHPTLGREVAVKLISPEYRGDAELNRRFLQEARVTANFRHPNIVEIYDLGELDGRAYYTMERLAGVDLATLLAHRGQLSPAQAALYFEQICAGLEAAHRVGVVHRDLKPANIFVVSEDPLQIKLMDFGIAKVSEQRSGSETRRGVVLGTPAYMSPEQALGRVDAITLRTDLYALGIIGYEMLTGQLPFQGDSDLLLLTMQIRDQPRPILELAPHTPPQFAALLERCLAKDPVARPASAQQLVDEMWQALQEPLPAHEQSLHAEPGELEELGPAEPSQLPEAYADDPAQEEPRSDSLLAPEPSPIPLRPAPAAPRAFAAPAPMARYPAGFEPAPSLLLSEITDGPPGLLTLSNDDGKVLDKLLRRMQRRADFPSFLNNVSEISRRADANADYSARELSEVILKDFALTAKLLRMVNGLFANRFGGRVYSINQAVLILGFDSVRSMALGVSIFKQPGQIGAGAERRTGRFHEQLADAAINSLISGEIARLLAPRAGVRDVELAMMCAMFRNLGQQLVLEYLPDEYEKINELMRRERISQISAAQRVLGMSMPKIALGVAERWCLPASMRVAMSQNPRLDAPLVREEDRMSALAKLSNDLCHVVATAEGQSYKPLMHRLFQTHKRLVTLDDKALNALIGTVCKSFEARYSALFGPYHKKSRFLFNGRGITGQRDTGEHRASKPLSGDERARVERGVAALAAGLQNRQPADSLLLDGLQALRILLDARRLLLLVQTSDRKELEVRLAVGDEAKALQSHFRVPISQGADFFSSTLRSSKNLVVADALGGAAMRRLPQRYYEVIGSPAFGLYVCASRGYPTSLVLVDADSSDYLPSAERMTASRGLRELLAKIAERR